MPTRPKWIPILLTIFALTYGNLVVSNMISYRQMEYSKTLERNNQTLVPLRDVFYTEWFPTDNIPYIDQIGLLTAVDAVTFVWVVGALILWCFNGQKVQHIAEVLCAELILLPAFAMCQWFTVIPDSLPGCLEKNNIPREGSDWVWYRVGRACGDMIWSSDMVQIIIFYRLYERLVYRKCGKCCKMFTRIMGVVVISLFTSLALAARYQYSTDMFVTMLVTFLTCTHNAVPKLAKCCFSRRIRDNISQEEVVPLNNSI